MNSRIIILAIFICLLFIPLRFNENKIKYYGDYGSDESRIISSISAIAPSVVGISVISQSIDQSLSWELKDGLFSPYTKNDSIIKSLGSGLIYSNDGYVITNAHVIQDASDIFVTLSGGRKFKADIVGYDILTDIALLKVDEPDLPVYDFGDSENLVVGQWVVALGNPLGLFDLSYEPTATIGIISGLNIDFGVKNKEHAYQNMIQTDASINEGNSGGPLINLNGEVIGINTFIMTGSNSNQGSIGIGFSIPINRVQDIVHDLILYGEVKRTYSTGLTLKPMNTTVQNYLNVPFNNGAVIVDIEKKSTGMVAGLQIGDIILKVDGILINSHEDMNNINRQNFRKAGDTVYLEVWRQGETLSVNLELKNYQ
tara:strand:+ start:7862 stop:8971 length:1110 start_codon:yes stop_codon:yes gene_type:complete